MKNKFIIIAIIIGISVFILMLTNNVNQNENEIVAAFAKGEYISEGSSVEAVVNYGNRYLNDDDKKELLDNIAKQIGLNNKYEYNIERNAEGETVSIVKKAKNATTIIKFVSIENKIEDSVIELEQYIIVNINFNNSVEAAVIYKSTLEEIFDKMNLSCDLTINLTGSYNGKLSDELKDSIVEELLKDIDADIVTENRESNMYNIYAYTDIINEYITVDNEDINVNLAINYDESINKTNIILSSPIINVDY